MALDSLREMSPANITTLLLIASSEKMDRMPHNKEDLYVLLSSYFTDGMYEGSLGDIMPQIVCSCTGIRMLIIDIEEDITESRARFVVPESIFNRPQQNDDIAVLLRQWQHYECLFVPTEG